MTLFKKEKHGKLRVITIFGFKFTYTKKSKFNDSNTNYHNFLNQCGYSVTKGLDGYLIEKDNFKIFGVAENTLWTCSDVLCKEDYALAIQEDYIMIDIGANIGITSLYSAQNDHIKHIYGFEPFKQTYDQAQINLNMNPSLANKISFFQYGLGDEIKHLDIHYNEKLPGSMSTVQDRFGETKQIEHIEIVKATDALTPIMEKHSEKIFMKIDCEGAENEILVDLDASGFLKNVNIIIMEWHFTYPSMLINILLKNNFLIFTNQAVINELGMIRAVRQE